MRFCPTESDWWTKHSCASRIIVIEMADQPLGRLPGFFVDFPHNEMQADAESHLLSPASLSLSVFGGQSLANEGGTAGKTFRKQARRIHHAPIWRHHRNRFALLHRAEG